MCELTRNLQQVIGELCPANDVAILLSGGADSTVVGLAAHHLGKTVHSFSFRMEGIDSWDFNQAQKTSETLGWKFNPVVVPQQAAKVDFLRTIQGYGCKKKTEVEVLLPFIHLADEIHAAGFESVLSGFTGPLPTNSNNRKQTRQNLAAYWKKIETETFDSTPTERCFEYAKSIGLTLLQPLSDKRIKSLFYGKTWDEIHTPYWKAPWKLAYPHHFQLIGLLEQSKTPPRQVSGRVQSYFEPLLADPEINFRGYTHGSSRQRLSQLVKLWSKHDPSAKPPPYTIRHEMTPYSLAEVKAASSQKRFTVVSTFAGGGGSSTGYNLSGGNVLLVNEFVSEAVKTYQANYPQTAIAEMDIRKITGRGGRQYALDWFKDYGIEKDNLDILDGSPPCATFSSARSGADKSLAKNVKYSDVKQSRIGMLIHDFVYLANCIMPKVCVIENVPQIRKADAYLYAMDRLRRWGYKVNGQIMYSSTFDVAQRRERFITLAIHPDISKIVGIRSDADVADLFPKGSIYEPTTRDALAGVKNDPDEVDYLLSATIKSARYELVKMLPKNPALPIGLSDIEPSWTSHFNLKRASWDKPCPTLTQMGQQAAAGGIYHPSEDRVFTIAELKRLTGLPDDFRLTGSFNKKAERCCRMVTPPLYKHLADSIFDNVLQPANAE